MRPPGNRVFDTPAPPADLLGEPPLLCSSADPSLVRLSPSVSSPSPHQPHPDAEKGVSLLFPAFPAGTPARRGVEEPSRVKPLPGAWRGDFLSQTQLPAAPRRSPLLFTRFLALSQALKNLLANAGGVRDTVSIPGPGRSPGGGHGNPPQFSCLENPMDRGAWRAAVHGVAKRRTGVKRLSTHTCFPHLASQL